MDKEALRQEHEEYLEQLDSDSDGCTTPPYATPRGRYPSMAPPPAPRKKKATPKRKSAKRNLIGQLNNLF